jgi:hypothetical protein
VPRLGRNRSATIEVSTPQVGHVGEDRETAGLAGDLLYLLGRAAADRDLCAAAASSRAMRLHSAPAAGYERDLAFELPIGHRRRMGQAHASDRRRR